MLYEHDFLALFATFWRVLCAISVLLSAQAASAPEGAGHTHLIDPINSLYQFRRNDMQPALRILPFNLRGLEEIFWQRT